MATLTFSYKPLPFARPLRHHRRRFSVFASAARQETTTSTAAWTAAPLSLITPATADSSLFQVSVSLSSSPSVAASHSSPGQYLQIRLPDNESAKPAFLAIASPPANGEIFEFLVKKVPGSTAELICELREGDLVEIGPVMGKGFPIERIAPDEIDTVLIFATGSGISAIRSLIESGFSANKRSDVRLYYGARNKQKMAYQDRFKSWESSGIKIIPVFSKPDDTWNGEQGYVQHAFLKDKQILNPSSTGVVLCGHKQMAEEITSALLADGVLKDRILMNF